MERTRKNIIILTAAFILVAVIGATFAYFTAQIGEGANVDIKANTDTVDALRFEVDGALSLRAGMDNFYNGAGNVEESTKARAILLANNTNNIAEYKYYVYLDIEDNDFVYTQSEDQTPELVLVVKDPEGNYLDTLENLTSTKVDIKKPDSTGEDDATIKVDGFDITNKTGLIKLSSDEEQISSSNNGEVTEEWEVTLVFVNFDKEQNENTNKELNAKLYIQAEERPAITITTDEINNTSMKVTASIDSKKEIKSIQFKMSDSEDWKDGSTVSTSEQTYTSTYTFDNLEAGKKYQINVKAIDVDNNETTRSKTERVLKLYTLTDVCPTGGNFASCVQKLNNQHPLYEETNLYYHDGSHKDYVINEQTKLSYVEGRGYSSIEEIVKPKCEAPYKYQGRMCMGENSMPIFDFYELAYETSGKKYTYLDATKKAITDGYINPIEKEVVDANDNSYRYAGDNPNNYVCFGNGAESYDPSIANSCPNKNLYRIIGAFDNGNGYQVKLIKSEYITSEELGIPSYGSEDLYLEDYIKYQRVKETPSEGFYWNTDSYTDENYNYWEYDGQKATLNEALNKVDENKNGYLGNLGATWASKIASTTWHIGEISANDVLMDGIPNNIAKSEKKNSSTGSYPASQTTSQAKIGLMYVSDYGFAAANVNSLWSRNMALEYYGKDNWENNWMYNGVYEWTIFRLSDLLNSAFLVRSIGPVGNDLDVDSYACGVRPVFYLDSDVTYVSGDGSINTPYVIN